MSKFSLDIRDGNLLGWKVQEFSVTDKTTGMTSQYVKPRDVTDAVRYEKAWAFERGFGLGLLTATAATIGCVLYLADREKKKQEKESE